MFKFHKVDFGPGRGRDWNAVVVVFKFHKVDFGHAKKMYKENIAQ